MAGERILLVEDNPQNRRLAQFLLTIPRVCGLRGHHRRRGPRAGQGPSAGAHLDGSPTARDGWLCRDAVSEGGCRHRRHSSGGPDGLRHAGRPRQGVGGGLRRVHHETYRHQGIPGSCATVPGVGQASTEGKARAPAMRAALFLRRSTRIEPTGVGRRQLEDMYHVTAACTARTCRCPVQRSRKEGRTSMVTPQATILVVDDDAKNVRLLEVLLRPRGYAVVTAANGAEALQQVHQGRPDLILLDVMMPLVDGFEVCKLLKDHPVTRLIPVVMMTAPGRRGGSHQGHRSGADDFLTKPVQP